MVINITECTIDQIKKIIDFHMLHITTDAINSEGIMDNDNADDTENDSTDKIEDEVKITPAKLIQLIQLVDNYNNIIKVLNHYKDFKEIDMEQFLKIKDHFKDTGEGENSNDGSGDDELIELNIKKSNEENDIDDDKEGVRLTWVERKIERNIKKLKAYELEIKDMENDLDNRQEKDKLNLKKKKIMKRLLEIQVEESKARLNTNNTRRNIKVNKSDLGLDYLEKINVKMEKDESEMSGAEILLKKAFKLDINEDEEEKILQNTIENNNIDNDDIDINVDEITQQLVVS